MSSVSSIDLTFDWEDLQLAGTLHLPAEPGPHPTVVMAQGSGPTDRTSGGYFTHIQRAFLGRAIATFAFDKPGCGESTGDWRNYGLHGRASQLETAIRVAGEHPATDAEKIGLWGHSQGGWLVQMLVGRRAPLAFAVASSAPSISVAEQISYDCENALRDAGFTNHDVAAGLEHVRSTNAAAVEGLSFDDVITTIVEPAAEQVWFVTLPTIDDAGDWNHLQLLLTEPHDPVTALEQARCPVLVVYGGRDRLLPPWQGARESGRALERSTTTDATVTVFPTGDHRLRNPTSETFVDGYLDTIANWAADRVS